MFCHASIFIIGNKFFSGAPGNCSFTVVRNNSTSNASKKRKRMNVSDDPRLKYSYCRTLQHRCIQTKVALQQIHMLCWSLLCQGLLPHRYHQPSPPEQCLQDCVLGAYLHLGFDSNYATLCKTKKTHRALHCEKALRYNTQTTEVS